MSKKIVPSFSFRALAQNLDGKLVAFEQRRQDGGDEWLLQNASKRIISEQWDHTLDEIPVTGRFDSHGQLHGRSLHFDRRIRVFVEGAIDDIGPADQFRHRTGIEAEALFGDHGNKTGAGLEIRIVELAVALILLEVGGIGG